MVLGSYRFTKYFSEQEEPIKGAKKIRVLKKLLSEEALSDLNAVLYATYKARDLVNEPQSYLTAAKMSEEIEALGLQHGFSVETLDKQKIQAFENGWLTGG